MVYHFLQMYGVAETYLEELGVDIVVANEIEETRAKFYNHLYPKTKMIVGDICDEKIRNQIYSICKKENVEFLIATPPCQGMSLAGKMDKDDPRNQLIYYAIDMIKRIKPKYVFLENVPQQLKTEIIYNGNSMLIPDYIHKELDSNYNFSDKSLVSAMDYDVPQMRKRNIFLLSRKDQKYIWQMPSPHKKITLRDALFNLPSVDPVLREGMEETLNLFPDFYKKKEQAEKLSKFHHPPVHAKKHVVAMMHTPSGCTAFDNKYYYPKKDDGQRVNGHYNTYRRYDWDKPCRTITQNSGVISSLTCVHPGKFIKNEEDGTPVYSDPRCLTIYELLIVSSLPTNWNIPDWADDNTIRKVIGEGIPPMLVKNIVLELVKNI